MTAIYSNLATHLHPLAIGNVYRGYRMAKMLTERLLKTHMDSKKDVAKIKSIVDSLTSLICIHHYPIMGDEAKEIGLKVEKLDGEEEEVIWRLYENYAQEMELDNPFNPIVELGDLNEKNFSYYGAYICV